jgi:hypothetical protein
MALIIGDNKCNQRIAAAGSIYSFETNNGSLSSPSGKSNSVSHAPILSYATRMARKKCHPQTPLTPPDSTRTSLENPSDVTSRHSLATADNHDWHSHSISPLPSPPLSPLAGTPSLESIIRQVRDVLAGKSAVCEISNVSSQLYDELSAHARADDSLAGWDDVRCAS